MKTKHEKIGEVLKDVALEAYKLGSRGRDLDWQSLNRYATTIDQLYSAKDGNETPPKEGIDSAGEEAYVKCPPSEGEYALLPVDSENAESVLNFVKKLTPPPQQPSEEGLKRFFLYLVDAGITDAIFDEESFDAYIYDNYITELLNR